MARNTRRESANSAYNSYIQNGFYNHTTEARKMEALPYEKTERYERAERYTRESTAPARTAPVRTPAPKRRADPAPKKVDRRNPKPEYVMAIAPTKRISFLSFLTITVLCAGVFACLFSFAVASYKQVELNRLGRQLKVAKEEVISLTAEAETLYDADEIALLATRLGMSKPKDYQIVEIEIPKTNFFVQYDYQPEPEPIKLGFIGMIDLFFK